MIKKIPSHEIIDLARRIQYEKTRIFLPSYKKPNIEYQMEALLVWIDEYAKPHQSELFLPEIQLDEK